MNHSTGTPTKAERAHMDRMRAFTYWPSLAQLLGRASIRLATKARSVVEMDRVASFEWDRLWWGWLRHESRFGARQKRGKA